MWLVIHAKIKVRPCNNVTRRAPLWIMWINWNNFNRDFVLMPVINYRLFSSIDSVVYQMSFVYTNRRVVHLYFQPWVEACAQNFYSIGLGFGVLVSMSSHNKFNYNCLRFDSVTLWHHGRNVHVPSALLALCAVNPMVTGKKGQYCGVLVFFVVSLNKVFQQTFVFRVICNASIKTLSCEVTVKENLSCI